MRRRTLLALPILATILFAQAMTDAVPAHAQSRSEVQSATPSEGPPGTLVTIRGRGLSRVVGVQMECCGDLPIVRRSATHIIVRIPNRASSGPMSVRYSESDLEFAVHFRVTR